MDEWPSLDVVIGRLRAGVPFTDLHCYLDLLACFSPVVRVCPNMLPEAGRGLFFLDAYRVRNPDGSQTVFNALEIGSIRLHPSGVWKLWKEGEPWDEAWRLPQRVVRLPRLRHTHADRRCAARSSGA
jgi:hypothetical protein